MIRMPSSACDSALDNHKSTSEGLAGFTLPLEYRGANPVGVQIQSQYPVGMGFPLQFLYFFHPKEIEMWVAVKETVNGTSRCQVQTKLQCFQPISVVGLFAQFIWSGIATLAFG